MLRYISPKGVECMKYGNMTINEDIKQLATDTFKITLKDDTDYYYTDDAKIKDFGAIYVTKDGSFVIDLIGCNEEREILDIKKYSIIKYYLSKIVLGKDKQDLEEVMIGLYKGFDHDAYKNLLKHILKDKVGILTGNELDEMEYQQMIALEEGISLKR
jgi:hypothetical protein